MDSQGQIKHTSSGITWMFGWKLKKGDVNENIAADDDDDYYTK